MSKKFIMIIFLSLIFGIVANENDDQSKKTDEIIQELYHQSSVEMAIVHPCSFDNIQESLEFFARKGAENYHIALASFVCAGVAAEAIIQLYIPQSYIRLRNYSRLFIISSLYFAGTYIQAVSE
ncbi:hypothetical protein K9K77_02910 [Candidatus Babeliales bacterium]|nr:hypothetical protein [Candidatus Babeliales bacterium]